MSASSLDKFKVDHLFLLVGENPLPNYIAARTLLKDNGTVYLVFTNHTTKQKGFLLEALNQYNIKCEGIDLANYESNSYHIRNTLHKRIKSLPPGIIGLNYTGGTKAMAVHAYKAIEEFAQEFNRDVRFSYLDPRKLKMCIDQPNNKPLEFHVPLHLSLKEIFNLHDNKWRDDKPPQSKPVLKDAAAKFAEFHENIQLAKEWRDWCDDQLHSLKYRGFWKSEDELKSISSISLQGLSKTIKNIISQELGVFNENIKLPEVKKKGFSNLTQICEWLDGIWLESYVLAKVQEIQNEFGIKESMMSFHIKDPQSRKERDRFEFDVAFIKGYQLFAISCTTSMNKKLCKEKLFEAHLRARQLGGDEARVALVCFSDRPEWIKDDMRFAIDDRKIEVFGIDDIENLADGIADWIESNNREANA
jgi:hypothetical protein